MQLIIISGPSGSGKTTLSEIILENIKDGLILNTDNYYRTGIISKILSKVLISYFDRKISINFALFTRDIEFILNGGINSINKAYSLSKEHDGVMLGRLIQSNPFCLSQVDKLFFNYENKINSNEKIILEYFNYIRPKINNDSIFRLLSPVLQIFFGVPDSKKFKNEIHLKIQNKEIEKLENLFIEFINQKNTQLTN